MTNSKSDIAAEPLLARAQKIVAASHERNFAAHLAAETLEGKHDDGQLMAVALAALNQSASDELLRRCRDRLPAGKSKLRDDIDANLSTGG